LPKCSHPPDYTKGIPTKKSFATQIEKRSVHSNVWNDGATTTTKKEEFERSRANNEIVQYV
jgi:hypothetical protein